MSPHTNNFYSSFILYINISSELTDVKDSNKPVITPQNYSEDVQILESIDTVLLNGAASKFAVTPQIDADNNQIIWEISDDGKLVKQ